MKSKLFFYFLFIAMVFTGCKSCRKQGWKTSDNRIPFAEPKSGIVFTPKPGRTVKEVIQFLQDQGVLATPVPPGKIEYCTACDSSIFRIKDLTLPELVVFANTGPTPPVKPDPPSTSGANGDWGPAFFSVNYTVDIPELLDTNTATFSRATSGLIVPTPFNPDKRVLVGILDTGVEPYVVANFLPTSVSVCMQEDKYGWNFVEKSKNVGDNYGPASAAKFVLHGSPVAKFIIEQQKKLSNKLEILPVKILDSEGKGDLFHIMCGMAYAKKAGAKIINASFGFYAPYSDQVKLFGNFIDSITRDGIIIVAAAGNANAKEDSAAEKNGMNKDELRNIDKHLFFPAAFATTNLNVIAVTTIEEPEPNVYKVVDGQNHSEKNTVQVGFRADIKQSFYEPSQNPDAAENATFTRVGSSFAAPILTGLIAANYSEMRAEAAGQKWDRNFILNWLQNKNKLTLKNLDKMPPYTANHFVKPQ